MQGNLRQNDIFIQNRDHTFVESAHIFARATTLIVDEDELNEISIEADKQLTLNEYVPLASHTMFLIAMAAEGVDEIDKTFSISDLSTMLNEVHNEQREYINGEFKICQTDSEHHKIVYEPNYFDEAEFDDENISDEGYFSISALLHCVNEHVPGEFGFFQTNSEHYQILYKSEEEVIESFKERWHGFINPPSIPYALTKGVYQDVEVKPIRAIEDSISVFSKTAFEMMIQADISKLAMLIYMQFGFEMNRYEAFWELHQINFKQVLEICEKLTKYDHLNVDYRTNIMRVMADLEDAGLVNWDSKSGAFDLYELLHTTEIDE